MYVVGSSANQNFPSEIVVCNALEINENYFEISLMIPEMNSEHCSLCGIIERWMPT